MIAGRRMVRLSERGERALFAGCRPIDLAVSPFMTARRKAAWKRSKMPGQMRAFQALNVFGVRIWANKPRQFGGVRWRARRATVASYAK